MCVPVVVVKPYTFSVQLPVSLLSLLLVVMQILRQEHLRIKKVHLLN